MKRCINIDWLEVHVLEPMNTPRTADYFRALGFEVDERDYGTRVYKQMFTLLYPDGEPFIEVRRAPASSYSASASQYFEPNSVHLRLHNRTCYFDESALIMSNFICKHGYEFRRISRIDLALDFEKFDSGDIPAKFIARYFRGCYSKVNQCSISAHGKDMWDGRIWNSVGWGSRCSPIYTRFYNKTMELRESKDKPYIRQVWAHYGLVDDFIQLTKKGSDGEFYKPEIWRIEFAITSSVKNWVTLDVDENGNKTHRSIRNTLEQYYTKPQIWNVFSSLLAHYFHFKHYEEGKRKDRCEDKVLFHFDEDCSFFKVEKIATSKPTNNTLLALEKRLVEYKSSSINPAIHKAANVILDEIQRQLVYSQSSNPYDESEIDLFRRLVAYRINKKSTESVTHDREFVESFKDLEKDLFTAS